MPHNLFGVDVAGLEVASFIANWRVAYVGLALAGLWLVAWRRRAGWLVLGLLGANTLAWAVTTYPLQRLYALGVGHDRVSNVAYCQVAAAGNSPLETMQVGYTHFSRNGRPHHVLWGALVAALSGWDPGRVLTLYGWLPLLMLWGVVLSLYFGLRSPPGDGDWSPWERALVAGGATLLCASPLDFTSPYSPAWPMTFLLKPNHALGLVLFPWVLAACVRGRGGRGRLVTALLLHLLGWAFVLHAVYAAWGLALFAALSWWSGPRGQRRRDVLDALVPLALNAALTGPIVVRLVADRLARPVDVFSQLPAATAHLLEPTARVGAVFLVAAWGSWIAFRRGDRMGRLLSAQWIGALSIWAGYAGLSAWGLVEAPDEIYYWLRVLTGALAGVGLWDLAGRAGRGIPALAHDPARRAAAASLAALPWTLPYWWDPPRMDRYFERSRQPLPALLTAPGEFFRRQTPPGAVVASDPTFAWWMAALSGRRALLSQGLPAGPDFGTRLQVLATLVEAEDSATLWASAAPYGVTHLAVTPALLAQHGLSLAQLEARSHLHRVYFTGEAAGNFVAVFELEPSPGGGPSWTSVEVSPRPAAR